MKKLCPRKDASLSGVPTQVGTSDCRKFRRVSGLPGNLKKSAQVSGYLYVGSFDPSRDFQLLEVPTGVGTSEKPEEICSGVWGYPYVGSSDKSRKFRLSGVPTQVGTSDIPNRKSCSDLAFWIPIRTVPNSWET